MCLADGPALFGLAPLCAEAPPEKIRFGPDLEPIVRLMEETPREKCVPVFVAELKKGLPYRRFLAASLFAGIRRAHSHHEVYKVHAVHQVSMDVRAEERLLPLFWGLNGYKQRQEDFPPTAMTELRGTLPSAEKAAGEFHEGIERGEQDRAELAIVAMGRGQGARATLEQLWQYGCRNGSAGGHMAIVLANCFRALETIGWQEAEPALRFVVQDWFSLKYVKPDGYFQPNRTRVEEQLKHLPANWAGERGEKAATVELLGLIREGKTEPACALAMKQLRRGVCAQVLWDAVHLATAELLVRHKDGWGLASRPLHSNTSTNALHYAFRTTTAPATRLLILLQAVAWATDKTGGDRAGGLRDLSITDLPPSSSGPPRMPSRRSSRAPERPTAGTPRTARRYSNGTRADADRRAGRCSCWRRRPSAVPLFVQTAQLVVPQGQQ